MQWKADIQGILTMYSMRKDWKDLGAQQRLDFIGTKMKQQGLAQRAHKAVNEALSGKVVASASKQFVSPDPVRVAMLEQLMPRASAPAGTVQALEPSQPDELVAQAQNIWDLQGDELDAAVEELEEPAAMIAALQAKRLATRGKGAVLVAKLQAKIAAVGAGGAVVVPDGWRSLGDGVFDGPGYVQVHVNTLVVQSYWATMEWYFAAPDPSEFRKLRCMQMQPGEDVATFGARLLGEMERLNNSGSDQPQLMEGEVVVTLLAALSKSARYKQLYSEQEKALEAVNGNDRTVLGFVRHVTEVELSKQHTAMEKAKLAAYEQSFGVESSSSGGAGREKPAVEGLDLKPKARQQELEKGLSKWPQRDLMNLSRAMAKMGVAPSQPEAVAAAGYQGGNMGTAFAVPRPGNGGRGFQPQPPAAVGGRFGGNWGRGAPGPPPVPGAGGRGGAGGGYRQWQHIQQQQPPRPQPPPQGRNTEVRQCEGRHCRHRPGDVCYVTNPQVAHQLQTWNPPPASSYDYQVYLRNCTRTGETPKGAGGFAGQAAAAMAYPDEGYWAWGNDWGYGYGGVDEFPAIGSLGMCMEDDLAICVPDQQGWTYGQRASACGMAGFVLEAAGVAAAAGRVGFAPLPAAAAETKSRRLRHVDELEELQQREAQGVSSQRHGLSVSVSLMYQRDEDILNALLERETAVGRGALAAAAVGLRSFTPANQRLEQQQVQQLLLGRVVLGVDLQLPRDEDLLQQLIARAGVTARVMAGGGLGERPGTEAVSSMGAAAAAGVASLQERVAALPPHEQEQHRLWQTHEGGLVTFSNPSFSEGLSLCTPDGRWFLPQRALIDCGCEPPILQTQYGLSMGLKEVPLPEPKHLMKADGQLAVVDKMFPNVGMVLARGTANEAKVSFNMLSLPAGQLYQVIYCALMDHQAGGMGVDRVEQVYRWRPQWASHGDKHTVAELPVRCHRKPGQVRSAAAAAAWREVSREEWEVATAAGERLVGRLVQGMFAAVVERQWVGSLVRDIFAAVIEKQCGETKVDGESHQAVARVELLSQQQVHDKWAPSASCRLHSSAAHANEQCKLQLGLQQGCKEAKYAGAFMAAGLLAGLDEEYIAYSPGYQGLRRGLSVFSSQVRDIAALEQVRLPLLPQQQQPLIQEQQEAEEVWWDATEVWEEVSEDDCFGEFSTDGGGSGVTGTGFSGLLAWPVGCFSLISSCVLQVCWWWLVVLSSWVGWVAYAALYPTTFLALLHQRLAAHCWVGWAPISRQQSRQWQRGMQRRSPFRGWSARQWWRTMLMSLALLVGWCFCAVQGMDTHGTELSLLVTAGIAVLNVRHLGGAAPGFRPKAA